MNRNPFSTMFHLYTSDNIKNRGFRFFIRGYRIGALVENELNFGNHWHHISVT